MIVIPKDNGEAKLTPESSAVTFEPRTLDDIRALGRGPSFSTLHGHHIAIRRYSRPSLAGIF
jgi:hypothetical protein